MSDGYTRPSEGERRAQRRGRKPALRRRRAMRARKAAVAERSYSAGAELVFGGDPHLYRSPADEVVSS